MRLDAVDGGRAGDLSELTPHLRREAVRHGVLLRPLGNVLYAPPPACLDEEQTAQVANVMRKLVEGLL